MPRGYETHETFWADLKMYFQMFLRAVLVGLFLQVLLMCFVIFQSEKTFSFIDADGREIHIPPTAWFRYHTGFVGINFANEVQIEKEILPYARGHKQMPMNQYRHFLDWLTDDAYFLAQQELNKWFKLSFFSYAMSVFYIMFFIGTSARMSDEKFVRGAQLTPRKTLNKKLTAAAQNNPLALRIGETVLPYEMEPKHMLILGTSGSGKSVLLNQLAAQITKRKHDFKTADRCIFYDAKGEFLSKQFQKGDLIFSPFDARTLKWNLFNEIEIAPDLDVICRSLFSAPDAKDAYWYNCASDVFRTGLVFLLMNKTTTNSDIQKFFSQPLAGIKAAFQTLPPSEQGALKHIDQSDSPASASIISILQERIQFFRYLTDLDGDFSFRQYVRGGQAGRQGNLFILNIEQYADIFRPLMSLIIDTMVREILSLPDDANRRVFFVLDELGTLNRMDSILQLLTVGRSKGGCLVTASQDLGRVEERYGKANLKTFFNNFNTTFTFRIREPETAEFLSRAIGEQQLIKTSLSRQMSPGDVGDRKSISEQEKTERLIMPAEFQSLPDLTAIVNIAGFGVSKITIPRIFFEERHPGFVMRRFAELKAPAPEASDDITVKDAQNDEQAAQPAQPKVVNDLKF